MLYSGHSRGILIRRVAITTGIGVHAKQDKRLTVSTRGTRADKQCSAPTRRARVAFARGTRVHSTHKEEADMGGSKIINKLDFGGEPRRGKPNKNKIPLVGFDHSLTAFDTKTKQQEDKKGHI